MTKHRNFKLRILFLLLILIPVFYFEDFYRHFYVYFTGSVSSGAITQQWHLVILCILLFVAFLVPLSFRRKISWSEYGLVSAFFVSLFVEMYGIPFTILFVSKYFFNTATSLPSNIIEFNFLNVSIGMDLAMAYGTVLMIIGMVLIIMGWMKLYRNVKKKGLVTDGIYSFSRHPQYFGFILIVLGWFVGWPTILTSIFTPILVYKYFVLCKTEEKELSSRFPEYEKYREKVPLFI